MESLASQRDTREAVPTQACYQPQATIQTSPEGPSSTKESAEKVKTEQITEPLLSPAQLHDMRQDDQYKTYF